MKFWRRVAGLTCLIVTLCLAAGPIAVLLNPSLLALSEVRPPHPSADLVSAGTGLEGFSLHTVRVYHVPVTMRDTLAWYFEEDIVGHYSGSDAGPRVFSYGFSAPLPNLPFPYAILLRYTKVYFTDRADYVEVITDTSYYWRTSGP